MTDSFSNDEIPLTSMTIKAKLLVENILLKNVLKQHGGWKPSTVAEGYLYVSIQNIVDVSNHHKIKCFNTQLKTTEMK